jgi:DNA-directed RNA polymerase subunit E'/Rpb7/16S rRNA G966 N2-methylase RsmD
MSTQPTFTIPPKKAQLVEPLIEPTVSSEELNVRHPKTKQEVDKLKKIFPIPPQKQGVSKDPYLSLFIDNEGLLYATPKSIVRDITSKIFDILEKQGYISRGQRISIVDATGGIGGDTINLARNPKIEHVYTTELDLSRFSALQENIKIFELEDKITVSNTNFIEWLKDNTDKLRRYPLYADLPWGGVDYKTLETVDDIFLLHNNERLNLRDLVRNYLNEAIFMVFKVPINYNVKAFEDMCKELELVCKVISYDNMKYLIAHRIKQNVLQTKRTEMRTSRQFGIYTSMMITQKAHLSILNVGDNIKQTLEKYISQNIEGKCIAEGYIKPQTTKIISYSSGELNGSDVVFEVVFECLVCSPVEGMHIDCVAKNITESAGIRAEVDDTPSPLVIYIARDHHFNNPTFSKVKVGDKIKVRVIGQRYELNDKYISVIAELLEDKKERFKKPRKLIIKD